MLAAGAGARCQRGWAFRFAVRTTGVFAALLVTRSGRYVKMFAFANAQQALDAGFRPCKRCQPDNARAQQRRLDKIACACRLLEQETPVTLASLAQAVAMSPFHLHRLFKASTGMTPKGWQQAWRARRLREALAKESRSRRLFTAPASRIAVATIVMPTRRWA